MELLEIQNIRKNIAKSRYNTLVPLPELTTIQKICKLAKEVLAKDNTLVENIHGNVSIVGDLHGNIDDLLYIINSRGEPNFDNKFVFLGDYVDRGQNSIETFLYLLCLKIEFPENVFLLRGNHEFTEVCKEYGFAEECISRLGMSNGVEAFKEMTNVFPYLPLAAVIQNLHFAVHGGLSARINTLDDIRNIDRFLITNFQQKEIVSDLVWGDPKKFATDVLTRKSTRGIGEFYSENKVKQFLKENGLASIFRAHEVCENGFNDDFVDEETHMPICITVFSASNYCEMGNTGSFLYLNDRSELSVYNYSTSDSSDSEPEDDFVVDLLIPEAILA
jgi:diadenosine tetraphosphatase ApaH/serine/threonine PP2A family protein phosphatase